MKTLGLRIAADISLDPESFCVVGCTRLKFVAELREMYKKRVVSKFPVQKCVQLISTHLALFTALSSRITQKHRNDYI